MYRIDAGQLRRPAKASLHLAEKRETTGNVRARLDFVAGKVLPRRVTHTPPAWAEQLHIAEEVVVPSPQAIQPGSIAKPSTWAVRSSNGCATFTTSLNSKACAL
jgi:hypothetical protein